MKEKLLVVGSVFNLLLGIFHIWLGWQIHQMATLAPEERALMEMLNIVGTLVIFFFAYTSFFHRTDLLTTGLGKATLLLITLFYLLRAAGEIIIFPEFSALIFALCLLVGGIYLVGLVRS